VAGPYFLFVGNPLPHKNLDRLLRAVEALPPEVGRLVVAGVSPAHRPRIEALAAGPALRGRVTILPRVSRETLVRLYQGALLLACPSLWEGFGLPALEAMACGTPVVAAARGALPEVVGDAALLVDPLRVDALRDALYTLAVHEAQRGALGERGRVRARMFSWRRAAEATLAVYREVGRAPAPG
jgi:alpha-1,3-rhamnosyl/mannosyltransferase